MSTLAQERRRARRKWAIAGGSHDRFVGLMRIVLPAAVGVLGAFLAAAPLTVGRDISFVLAKDQVDIAPERMRVSQAVYRGRDTKGEPFQLTAQSAVQQTSQTPIVHLQKLDAQIHLTDGPATILADQGRYDMDTTRIALDGPVTMDDSTGRHIVTRDILLDMKTKIAVSRGHVDGTMPLGSFSADRMRTDLDAKTVDLIGRARLHIVQRQTRGAR